MRGLLSILFATATMSSAAFAGPGDVLRVNTDLVNLRAGPADTTTVRDRVEGGAEVIEDLDESGPSITVKDFASGADSN